MVETTVRVYGVREVNAAFRQVDTKLASSFGNDLKVLAEPVVQSAKAKISRFQGASLGTIRARRLGPVVYVEQSARKVTGKHPDFGREQLEDLEAALGEKADEIFVGVERVLDKYSLSAGF